MKNGQQAQNQRGRLQARHRGAYGQVDTMKVERGFIGLVGEVNTSDSLTSTEKNMLHNSVNGDDTAGVDISCPYWFG